MCCANFWNQFYLCRKKVAGAKKGIKIFFGSYLLLIYFSFLPAKLFSQENLPSYDHKRMHFGVVFGTNRSNFKIVHTPDFNQNDTLYVVESTPHSGVNIGIISDLHISEFFNLRFIPSLILGRRELNYTFVNNAVAKKLVESTFIDFPLTLKYKSMRIKNFRLYVIGGVKYGIDLDSQSKVKEKDDEELLVKLYPHNLAYEYGFGFDHYFPMFKFSIELKMSNGINNILVPETHIFSSSIEKLFSKIMYVSLNFE